MLTRPGEFQISVCRDITPIYEVIRSIPGTVDLRAQTYPMSIPALDELSVLQRRGKIGEQHLVFDRAAHGQQNQFEFDEVWIPSIASLGLVGDDGPGDRVVGGTHSKWFVLDGSERRDSVLSSSNDGCEKNHLEWWASSRDEGLAEYLVDERGHGLTPPVPSKRVGKIEGGAIARASSLLPFPLAQVSVIRASSLTPSSAILFWLIQACGEPVDLSLMSFSSSMGFCAALAELREQGHLGSLRWAIDHSLKTRKASKSEGRVLQSLREYFPGEVTFPHSRIHGKWAVIRTPSQSISVLTSANWQETNPREESYVVTTDPAVAAGLENVQANIDTPTRPRPTAVPTTYAPQFVQTSTLRPAELERILRLR